MTWLEAVADLATVVAAFVGVALYLRALHDDLRSEVRSVRDDLRSEVRSVRDDLRSDVRQVGQRLDALAAAVLELTHLAAYRPGVTAAERLSFQAHMRRLFLRTEPTAANPLSADDLARFRRYGDLLIERPLTVEEARDLKALADRVAEEHPENADAAGLAQGAAFLVAFAEALPV